MPSVKDLRLATVRPGGRLPARVLAEVWDPCNNDSIKMLVIKDYSALLSKTDLIELGPKP